MNGIQKILEAHQKFTFERNFDGFQTPKNLSMALSVEVAELVEIFTWLSEKQAHSLTNDQLSAASDEIADIFIYLLRLADTLNIDLIEASNKKMIKNIKKYPIEKGQALAKALMDS
jgi:NTP pyrophosphatase (non-canonical NTP hydrolase)